MAEGNRAEIVTDMNAVWKGRTEIHFHTTGQGFVRDRGFPVHKKGK